VFIAAGIAPFAAFVFSRFCWDCKGRNIFYFRQIYFEVFSEESFQPLSSPISLSFSLKNLK